MIYHDELTTVASIIDRSYSNLATWLVAANPRRTVP